MDRQFTPEMVEALGNVGFQSFDFSGYRFQLYGIRYSGTKVGQVCACPAHQHSFYEFFYVTRGRFETIANGRQYGYDSSQFGLLIPGLQHTHPQSSFALLAIRFRVESSPLGGRISPSHMGHIDLGMLQKLSHRPMTDPDGLLWRLISEIIERGQEGADTLELALLIAAFLVRVFRFYSLVENPEQAEKHILDNNVVNAAVSFLQEHCLEAITVHDVAAYVHISYSHLSRLFAQQGRPNIHQMLQEARIDHAQKLLHTTDLSISDIATACCFKYTSHFCKVFQQIVGVSPSNYRRGAGEENSVL